MKHNYTLSYKFQGMWIHQIDLNRKEAKNMAIFLRSTGVFAIIFKTEDRHLFTFA